MLEYGAFKELLLFVEMNKILLTGAGFSRIWGGWLAEEAFEYLIGIDGLDLQVRRLLWDHKERKTGFEGVYEELRRRVARHSDVDLLVQFDAAVAGMFHVMGHGFASATIHAHFLRFLAQFDAIFTLNQDTLMERKYLAFGSDDFRQMSGGRFFGAQAPGLKPASDMVFEQPGLFVPADPPFETRDRHQPYFKLHGSSNWKTSSQVGQAMLILGGGKESEISRHPLSSWYFGEFDRYAAGSQILIIGYSFSDEHVNRRLCLAASRGARLFIVDPHGVDVIDKRDKRAQIPQPRSELIETLFPAIDGASRRDLNATLLTDHVERRKLDHFLSAGDRRPAPSSA